MTTFDDELRNLLEGEANRVAPDETRRGAAVRRVRRRRAARAGGVGVFTVALAVASISGAGALLSPPEGGDDRKPAALVSALPSWEREAYPVLATGAFEGRSWTLYIRDLPDYGSNPEVVFEIEAPAPNAGSFETHDDWDGIDASFQGRVGGAGDYVMGMVVDDAATVTIVTPEERLEAPVFGYEETRYFLAFVPRGARGLAVAHSESGEILGSARLPGAGNPAGEIGCPRGDGHIEPERRESGPVLGEGTFDGKRWTLTLIEDPDAAHPEDLESENPEIAFHIEGPWPNAGSMETYDRWDGVSAPFHDAMHGGSRYGFGMTSAEAASVTVELDEGDPVAAELFDARDVPRPGAQVYVAFLPSGATGEVVARDASGVEIGRAPLPAAPEAPHVCDTQ